MGFCFQSRVNWSFFILLQNSGYFSFMLSPDLGINPEQLGQLDLLFTLLLHVAS